jgi:hypothetical protein
MGVIDRVVFPLQQKFLISLSFLANLVLNTDTEMGGIIITFLVILVKVKREICNS